MDYSEQQRRRDERQRRSDEADATFLATIIWRTIYGILAIALLWAGIHTYGIVTAATTNKNVQPGVSTWTVVQSHDGGRTLEVQHDDDKIVLEERGWSSAQNLADHDEHDFATGEHIQFQVLCKDRMPVFYKKFEDGEGEREYSTGFGSYDVDRKICPE